MRKWKIIPNCQRVAEYVDCYWLIEQTQGDSRRENIKLNPDPAAHLILSNSKQYYRYELNGEVVTGTGSHLMHPHCKLILIDHSLPFTIIGVKFRVGALYSLPQLCASVQLDKIINFDVYELFKLESKRLSQIIEQPELCRDVLDLCLERYCVSSYEDKHSKIVRQALPLLAKTSISSVGSMLGCSQRTIERSFSRVTGLTQKQYQSVFRLENLLEHLYALELEEINWSDIAAQFGFSDQPHLIRYLKGQIQATPKNYAVRRNLTIDVYGDFK